MAFSEYLGACLHTYLGRKDLLNTIANLKVPMVTPLTSMRRVLISSTKTTQKSRIPTGKRQLLELGVLVLPLLTLFNLTTHRLHE